MRAFIAIKFPEILKEEIKKIQEKLPKFLGKKTEIENIHLTLKFLGEIDFETSKKVVEILKVLKSRRFLAEIDSIGVFSKDAPRIVWLHIKNAEGIQKEIDEKLSEIFKREKRFMGHVTIARIKKVENKKRFLEELIKIKIKKIKFEVNQFFLIKSELTSKGPRYEIVESFELNKA
ncbi:RNA 2',3'-cyclic phosphodiesterase [Candidatus Pacearchaeota archaeon]|nr:RNA 2',3'-cyclic phosphodiesterase [Candidatus Pacearchaeota archaeon]